MIDDQGSVGLRTVNAAIERALMPYFQRSSLNDKTLPISGAPASGITSDVRAPIVEQAAAILDRETTRETSRETMGTGGLGGARDLDEGLLPIANVPALADLQRRASEVFAAFLEGFARPPSLSTASAPMDAASREPATTVPLIAAASAVKAGEAAIVAVKLVNDQGAPANLLLYSTDFVSDRGSQIPASQVVFSPRTLALPGRAHGHSQMKVSIPTQSAPGRYSALVQAVGLGRPSAVVVLQVE